MYPAQLSNLISLDAHTAATLAFFLLSNHDDLPTWPEHSLLECFPSDLSMVDFFYHFDLSLDTPQRIILSHFSIFFTALISHFLFFWSVLFIEESPVSRIELDILNRC